MHDLLVTANLK